MSLRKVKFLLSLLTFVTLLIFSNSCEQPINKDHLQTKRVLPDSSAILAEVDSMIYYMQKSDSVKCQEILKFFNDPELAKKYPCEVYNAFVYSSFSNQQNQLVDSLSYLKTYNQLYDLALKSRSEHFMTYCELYRARNMVVSGKNEEAIPLYMELLPKFAQYNDNYAISLIYKRIGLTYLNIYNNSDSATKYLTKAFYIRIGKIDKSIIYDNLVKTYFQIQEFDSLKRFVDMLHHPVDFWRPMEYNTTYAFYQTYIYTFSDSGSTDSVIKYLNPFINYYFGHPDQGYYPDLMSCMSVFCEGLLKKQEYPLLDSLIYITLRFEKDHPEFTKLNIDFYHVAYKYYESKKDFQGALIFLKKYIDSKKILNLEEQKSKIELARMSYLVQQERIRAANAKMQQELISSQQLQRQKFIRNSFIAGFLSLLILIVVLINRHQLKRTIELEKMRSRLSRDLHDDIGSTLSSINILSRTAQHNLNHSNPDKIRFTLEKINERSQRLLDNMHDILWKINPGNDTFEEVMSRMREYATTILEAKGIDYTFNFPKEALNCKLNMEVKNNMYLIFKEAINNLSKYSRASHAQLSLTFDEKHIYLKIEDNGDGFEIKSSEKDFSSSSSVKSGGAGLQNMRHRALEMKGTINITSEIGKGTKIELSIPRFC